MARETGAEASRAMDVEEDGSGAAAANAGGAADAAAGGAGPADGGGGGAAADVGNGGRAGNANEEGDRADSSTSRGRRCGEGILYGRMPSCFALLAFACVCGVLVFVSSKACFCKLHGGAPRAGKGRVVVSCVLHDCRLESRIFVGGREGTVFSCSRVHVFVSCVQVRVYVLTSTGLRDSVFYRLSELRDKMAGFE